MLVLNGIVPAPAKVPLVLLSKLFAQPVATPVAVAFMV